MKMGALQKETPTVARASTHSKTYERVPGDDPEGEDDQTGRSAARAGTETGNAGESGEDPVGVQPAPKYDETQVTNTGKDAERIRDTSRTSK
jgi:hypothetical protein